MALAAGVAILGASFLLLWACDAAQADISQALALAVVALIAVLPEYAVDMYFTWQAGKHPDSDYAHYAIANMTGANRLLIGVAWGADRGDLLAPLPPSRCASSRSAARSCSSWALATRLRLRHPAQGQRWPGTTAWCSWACTSGTSCWPARRPLPRSARWRARRSCWCGCPTAQRRLATAGMFLFAAGVILANAEPFCEGLVGTGQALSASTSSCWCSGWRRSPRRRRSSSWRWCSPGAGRRAWRWAACSRPSSTSGRCWWA